MKTVLLENDDWFWKGLEDWCKSLDPDFKVVRTDTRDWMISDDFIKVGMLSQPFIENILVASSFGSEMFTPLKDEVYPQLLHYLWIIEAAFNVREKLGYKPFEIHVNYHDEDFMEDIKKEKWGWETSANIKRIIRQNEGRFVVKVYKEYRFLYVLT